MKQQELIVYDRENDLLYLAVIHDMPTEVFHKSLELHPEIDDYGRWNESCYYADTFNPDPLIAGMRNEGKIDICVLDEGRALASSIIHEDKEPRCLDELKELLS